MMPIPVAVGWLAKIGIGVASRWWIPLVAAISAWVLEEMVGVVSWGLLKFGSFIVDGILYMLQSVPAPASVSEGVWNTVSVYILPVGDLIGLWTALALYIASVVLRIVAWAVTFGKY